MVSIGAYEEMALTIQVARNHELQVFNPIVELETGNTVVKSWWRTVKRDAERSQSRCVFTESSLAQK